MDFCHPCRRHLNGALACPGCGTPAEPLRAQRREPAAPAGYEGEAYGAARSGESSGEHDDGDARDDEPHGRRATRRRGPEPEPKPDEGPAAGQSRRDRKAVAHRRRRNRTLLIVAGFVLAAGGLSLAELGLDAPGSSPEPAAAGEESADGGGAELEPTESSGGAPAAVTSTGSTGPKASGSPSPSASGSPKDEESREADDETGRDASSAPAETSTTAPATPQPEAPDASEEPETPEPTPTTKQPEPEPEPEPTKTCDRFLWWCT
ncbi:hypothetical protein ACH5A7_03130 [Streptomyces sp. NPDC018955]|uniref:SCO2400 family protein n=1 Tax=Streptomyces sp. NPDC018955 TaxID=3365055 RepID=UPI00378C7CF1